MNPFVRSEYQNDIYMKSPQYWIIICTMYGPNIKTHIVHETRYTYFKFKTLKLKSHLRQDSDLVTFHKQHEDSSYTSQLRVIHITALAISGHTLCY